MLTTLGKELRKLRIDQGLNMLEMAGAMNYSTAMLSAIETGKKKVPGDFVDRLIRACPTTAASQDQWQTWANLANREARVPLDGTREEDAQLITELARRFSELSVKDKGRLRAVLRKESL